MKYFFYILPVLAGLALTTQAGINSQLKIAVNNPWVAAFISFFTGTIFLALVLVFTRQQLPDVTELKQIGLYKYAGGLLGVFFVTVVIFSVERIGSTNMFALIIAGQFLVALLYDHFGLFGLPHVPINWGKVLGVVLLISGAYLVNRK
ncbi:MAG: DMT family transporter [Sediminibacterium sp.]